MNEDKINETPIDGAYSGNLDKASLGDPKTNQRIAAEIGQRLDRLRLEQDLTQQQLADEIGITRASYRSLINGKGKFVNMVALLRALGRLDLLENFVPETAFSPMAQLKLYGKQRQRASRKSSAEVVRDNDELDW